MTYSITASEPEYFSGAPNASRLFDRSALYTLAHNLQVGAALVVAYEVGWRAGYDSCPCDGPQDEQWERRMADQWRPNVDGKGG